MSLVWGLMGTVECRFEHVPEDPEPPQKGSDPELDLVEQELNALDPTGESNSRHS